MTPCRTPVRKLVLFENGNLTSSLPPNKNMLSDFHPDNGGTTYSLKYRGTPMRDMQFLHNFGHYHSCKIKYSK